MNTDFRNCNGGTAVILSSELSSGLQVTFINCRFYNLVNPVVPPDTEYEKMMGGALRVLGSVELRLVNCSFYNNQAVWAAAIYARVRAGVSALLRRPAGPAEARGTDWAL